MATDAVHETFIAESPMTSRTPVGALGGATLGRRAEEARRTFGTVGTDVNTAAGGTKS